MNHRDVLSGMLGGVGWPVSAPVLCNSSPIAKVKQVGERTRQAVQKARPGVSEQASAVSQMKWNWNKTGMR